MKKKLILLSTAILFGGMLMFSSDSAKAGNEVGGATMNCKSSTSLCDFKCSSCGILLGSPDGRNGEPSNVQGNCPACGAQL